jgi:hypothetical protein
MARTLKPTPDHVLVVRELANAPEPTALFAIVDGFGMNAQPISALLKQSLPST